ncbi:unnamed protein product, partial [Effrenium voratum]
GKYVSRKHDERRIETSIIGMSLHGPVPDLSGEQYVRVGQAKAWLQQNEEALPSQRSSLRPSLCPRRGSRSPGPRHGHSLVTPSVPPDLPEREGVVKPHRSTALALLEGSPPEGMDTCDSLIETKVDLRSPVTRAVSGIELTSSPLAKLLNRQRRNDRATIGLAETTRRLSLTRSTPDLEEKEIEVPRPVQVSPSLTRRTLHPAMFGSPRAEVPSAPVPYWPTLLGFRNDPWPVVEKPKPAAQLSPPLVRRSIEPAERHESVVPHFTSPTLPCRSTVSDLSWNPPRMVPEPREFSWSWQPRKMNFPVDKAPQEKVCLQDTEPSATSLPSEPKLGSTRTAAPGSMSVPRPDSRSTHRRFRAEPSPTPMPPQQLSSRATLRAEYIGMRVNRSPLPRRQDVSMTPPAAPVRPQLISVVSEKPPDFKPMAPYVMSTKTPTVVMRCVKAPIQVHAAPAPRIIGTLDNAKVHR